jgi:predicted Zn-ribbon and HTH transcriptional regulator
MSLNVHMNIKRVRPGLATPNPESAQAFPTTRTEFMAEDKEKLKPIKAILETIREQAAFALKQLQEAEEVRAMRWACKKCRYVKYFTRPVSFEAVEKCPRCKSIEFEALA